MFDVCAMIANLDDESRADVVEGASGESNDRCWLHAINRCEVFFYRVSDKQAAGKLLAIQAGGVKWVHRDLVVKR